MLASERGLWAVKFSFAGLIATALLQVVVVWFSGSVALLADTIHNFGDALTAVPLWVAFRLATSRPSKRFTYGYGRVEDLAGVAIVIAILVSAVITGYESARRLFEPRQIDYLWAVMGASVIGFLGNEAVALYRIRIGKEIGSAALIADGYHARADGLTSLAVLAGTAVVWLGYPLADPVAGLLVTAAILRLAWESGRTILERMLDGVDPDLVDEIRHVASLAPGVKEISEVRVRWLGHRLHAELNLAVARDLSVEDGHNVANETRHRLLHRLRYLSTVTIHVDPANASGDAYHRIDEHSHDGLPAHSH